MNMKKWITAVLLLFVAAAAGTIVFKGLWSGNSDLSQGRQLCPPIPGAIPKQ